MRKRDAQLINLSKRLESLDINLADQDRLRKIEMTLSRWSERECNGEIERDEVTGKMFASYEYNGPGGYGRSRFAIADKERGALKRLAAVMAKYSHLWYYHQGDPRGCALYVGRWADVGISAGAAARKPEMPAGLYTRGVAVCL